MGRAFFGGEMATKPIHVIVPIEVHKKLLEIRKIKYPEKRKLSWFRLLQKYSIAQLLEEYETNP